MAQYGSMMVKQLDLQVPEKAHSNTWLTWNASCILEKSLTRKQQFWQSIQENRPLFNFQFPKLDSYCHAQQWPSTQVSKIIVCNMALWPAAVKYIGKTRETLSRTNTGTLYIGPVYVYVRPVGRLRSRSGSKSLKTKTKGFEDFTTCLWSSHTTINTIINTRSSTEMFATPSYLNKSCGHELIKWAERNTHQCISTERWGKWFGRSITDRNRSGNLHFSRTFFWHVMLASIWRALNRTCIVLWSWHENYGKEGWIKWTSQLSPRSYRLPEFLELRVSGPWWWMRGNLFRVERPIPNARRCAS
jgi:hypothetical protein